MALNPFAKKKVSSHRGNPRERLGDQELDSHFYENARMRTRKVYRFVFL